MSTKKRRSPMSIEQESEAARLLQIWNAKRKVARLTQEAVAEHMGWTQGAVHQYLYGKIALNERAILGFAELLKFDPRQVRPSIRSLPMWMHDSSDASVAAREPIASAPAKADASTPASMAVPAANLRPHIPSPPCRTARSVPARAENRTR